jgi:hypothetical protein
MSRPTVNRIAMGAATALLAGGAIVAIALSGSSQDVRQAAAPDVALRTLVVSPRHSDPVPSRPGRTLHARLTGGRMPRAAITAVVTSDEDCAPDAAGISNCLNRLRLADGTRLAVRHPHRMAEVPCLSPGERVKLHGA